MCLNHSFTARLKVKVKVKEGDGSNLNYKVGYVGAVSQVKVKRGREFKFEFIIFVLKKRDG